MPRAAQSPLELLIFSTAVFKKVVGTHFFFALFGPLGARFSPPPLRQPHGIKVSHIAKLNHAVTYNEFKSIERLNSSRLTTLTI